MTDWDLYTKRLNINGNTMKDRYINNIKDAIANDFENSPSYRESYFNGSISSTDIQIIDDEESYIKKILMKPDVTLSVGDITVFDNITWMCIDVDKTNPVYEYGIVQKASHSLSLYKNGILSQVPIIIESAIKLYQLGSNENSHMEIPSTTIVGRIQNNSTNIQISRGDIFKIGINNWEVKDINDILEPGILILKMEFSEVEQSIPVSQPTYYISGDDILRIGSTKTYVAKKFINGAESTTATFIFSVVGSTIPESAYTLTVIDNKSISIKCNQYSYVLTIRATDNSDNTKYCDLDIKLSNLF